MLVLVFLDQFGQDGDVVMFLGFQGSFSLAFAERLDDREGGLVFLFRPDHSQREFTHQGKVFWLGAWYGFGPNWRCASCGHGLVNVLRIRGLSDCALSTLRYFLCAKIIFVVGQDTANENHTTLKEDFQDESVFIPTNIDHDVLADEVSSRIIGLEVGELFPIGLLGASVPAIQGHSGVRIIFPGLPEPSATDNTQVNNLRGSE